MIPALVAWVGVAVAVALVVALPLLRELLRDPVAPLQSAPDGRMLRLAHGLTHVRDEGPAAGPGEGSAAGSDERPVAVLVHGLTTPSFVFDGLARELVARGVRVVRYDHYGRGLSDRPRIPQTAEIFRQHLTEVLDACGLRAPVLLLGYSMGGAIVADFAAHHPDRVARLVLVAPGGMKANAGGWFQRVSMLPVLGDWLFHMVYPARLRAGIAAERALPGCVPDIADRQWAETTRRGYFRLVLASLRGLLAGPQTAAHRRVAALGLPVVAVFGAEDDVIPLAARDLLAQWNPAARLVTVPGAGHGLTYTHASEVLAVI